jgi:hypothetical protein
LTAATAVSGDVINAITTNAIKSRFTPTS